MSSQFIDIEVSPSRAASILELQDLRLIKLTWEMLGGPIDPPYSFVVEPQLGYTRQDEWVVFEIAHHFTVSASSQGSETKPILTGAIVYQASYRLPSTVQLDDADLSVFGNSTVVLAVHPFLRELLHSLTTRSGLPPLVLPLFRTHIAATLPAKEQLAQNRSSARTDKTKEAKRAAKRASTQAVSVKRSSAKKPGGATTRARSANKTGPV